MTIKNLKYGRWLPYDESSDSPSDRKGDYKEKSDNLSSNYGMLFEDEHKGKVLSELEEQTKKIEAARDETKNLAAKDNLFINLNKRNKYIPYGAVVVLRASSIKGCKVEYQDQEYTTKQIFLKKIWS